MEPEIFTLEEAKRVFKRLACDERIPFADPLNCTVRKNAMTGIMLDELHVPPDVIGAMYVSTTVAMRTDEDDIRVPNATRFLTRELYLEECWVEQRRRMDKK